MADATGPSLGASLFSRRPFRPGESARPEEVAPGVTRETCAWGWWFYGSTEALLSAGVVIKGCLPGDPGQCKSVSRFSLDGREHEVHTRGRRNRFLAVSVTRSKRDQEALDGFLRFEEARMEESKAIAQLPSDPAMYRKNLGDMVKVFLAALRTELISSKSGYRVDREGLESFDDVAIEMLKVVHTTNVIFERSIRDRTIASIKHKTAAADPHFSAFIATIAAVPPAE